MEARLIKVEAKVDAVASDMSEIKTSMQRVAASLEKLAVLEEKHNSVTEATKRAFKAIEKNTERLDLIEKAMPNLILASSWVFKAAVAIMGLLSAAALATILQGVM